MSNCCCCIISFVQRLLSVFLRLCVYMTDVTSETPSKVIHVVLLRPRRSLAPLAEAAAAPAVVEVPGRLAFRQSRHEHVPVASHLLDERLNAPNVLREFLKRRHKTCKKQEFLWRRLRGRLRRRRAGRGSKTTGGDDDGQDGESAVTFHGCKQKHTRLTSFTQTSTGGPGSPFVVKKRFNISNGKYLDFTCHTEKYHFKIHLIQRLTLMTQKTGAKNTGDEAKLLRGIL